MKKYIHTPQLPDLRGSYLFGIPKLNPLWWFNLIGPPEYKFLQGQAPEEWKVNQPIWWRNLSWVIRNPCYNLFNFVLGFRDKEHVRYGEYPDNNWLPDNKNGFLFAYVKYQGWGFPFISYRGKWIEFYAGWKRQGELGSAFRKRNAKGHLDASGKKGSWWW